MVTLCCSLVVARNNSMHNHFARSFFGSGPYGRCGFSRQRSTLSAPCSGRLGKAAEKINRAVRRKGLDLAGGWDSAWGFHVR
jgi:hypothetical protein